MKIWITLPLGFEEGYFGAKSKFSYLCKKHGKVEVSCLHFIHNSSRCKKCFVESNSLYGYYSNKSLCEDNLYLLNVDGILKIGRSFNINKRIKRISSDSKAKNIFVIKVFKGKHKEVFDCEQDVLQTLEKMGEKFYQNWSTECTALYNIDLVINIIKKHTLEEICNK